MSGWEYIKTNAPDNGVEIKVSRDVLLIGRVVFGESGEPVKNITVTYEYYSEIDSFVDKCGYTGGTDESGYYVLHVPLDSLASENRTVVVRVDVPGFEAYEGGDTLVKTRYIKADSPETIHMEDHTCPK